MEIVFGILAFILFMLYDLEQARFLPLQLHKFTQFFFVIGFLLLLASTAVAVWHAAQSLSEWSILQTVFLVMTALFFLLLIYTLFFALPFEETYVTQNGCKTYDRGMYALCRHPGVLWFTGCYLFLWMTFGGKELLLLAMINCLLNFLYVVLQDGVTFPRVFTDYNIYKQRVPFLIPTVKSIQMCIQTWKN